MFHTKCPWLWLWRLGVAFEVFGAVYCGNGAHGGGFDVVVAFEVVVGW